MKICILSGILLGVAALLPGEAARAQGMSTGEQEYRNSCAICHGDDGKGHGMLEGRFDPLPSDLTALSKRNGGVFPLQRVYDVIEGTGNVPSHGTRQMPIWGNRYRAQAAGDPEYPFSTDDQEIFARTRILTLIEYLSAIQGE